MALAGVQCGWCGNRALCLSVQEKGAVHACKTNSKTFVTKKGKCSGYTATSYGCPRYTSYVPHPRAGPESEPESNVTQARNLKCTVTVTAVPASTNSWRPQPRRAHSCKPKSLRQHPLLMLPLASRFPWDPLPSWSLSGAPRATLRVALRAASAAGAPLVRGPAPARAPRAPVPRTCGTLTRRTALRDSPITPVHFRGTGSVGLCPGGPVDSL